MSDPNVPPPVSGPPPIPGGTPPPFGNPPPASPQPQWSPPRKGPNWPLIVGIFVLLLIGGVVAIVIGAKSWYESHAAKVITTPAKAGRPTIKPIPKDTWVRASFPEVPTTVDLPAKPVFVPLKPESFDEYSKLVTDQYAEYEANTEETNISIAFYWMTTLGNMTSTDRADLRDFASEYVADWAKDEPTFLDLKSAPRRSVALRIAYEPEGAEANTPDYYAYYLFVKFSGGMQVYGVFPEPNVDGQLIIERIAASMNR